MISNVDRLLDLMHDHNNPALQWLPNNHEILKLVEYLDGNGVIVPPCKVGDVVYGYHPANGTTILPMVAKWIETSEEGWTVAAQYVPMAPKFYLFSDFGKTVFLTREEAERALAEME